MLETIFDIIMMIQGYIQGQKVKCAIQFWLENLVQFQWNKMLKCDSKRKYEPV